MAREISNSDDFIESRDIIERIDELLELKSSAEEDDDELDDDYQQELDVLLDLKDQAEGCADWSCGETLIRNSYFEEYAEQLAEDIGAISRDLQWPLDHIDWEAAADALKMDYTSVDFDGVEYWIRS